MKSLIVGIVLLTAAPALAEQRATHATVTGWVIDSACLFIQNLEKPVNRECALNCARAGSPLVILADDGTVYLPISAAMPAVGQNERMMEFAGERVTLRGKVFQRGGSHAVVIEEIEKTSIAR